MTKYIIKSAEISREGMVELPDDAIPIGIKSVAMSRGENTMVVVEILYYLEEVKEGEKWMKPYYIDIIERIDEEPKWYDKNGTPRYRPFHPDLPPAV